MSGKLDYPGRDAKGALYRRDREPTKVGDDLIVELANGGYGVRRLPRDVIDLSWIGAGNEAAQREDKDDCYHAAVGDGYLEDNG